MCVSLYEFVLVNADNLEVKGIGCPRAELQVAVSCHMWILETELEVCTLNHEPSLQSRKTDFSKKQCLVLVGCSLFFFNYGNLCFFFPISFFVSSSLLLVSLNILR